MSEAPRVWVVDDDPAIRDSVETLLRSVGLDTRAFASADEFLGACGDDPSGCLVLDVRMPRMGGLELQAELNRRGLTLPVIFMTGHGDVPLAVEAMRAGAVDFLQKPFQDEELIRRVQQALEEDSKERAERLANAEVRERWESLTPREREVAELVVAGDANKVIAAKLGLSDRTVEVHRARIMQKMEARSLAQLVHMARDAGVAGGGPGG